MTVSSNARKRSHAPAVNDAGGLLTASARTPTGYRVYGENLKLFRLTGRTSGCLLSGVNAPDTTNSDQAVTPSTAIR